MTDPDLAVFLSIPPEGPDPATWSAVDAAVGGLVARGIGMTHPALAPHLAPVLGDRTTLMGHISAWPWGHAGDFEIIDRLHRDLRSATAPLWDAYIQNGAAARAVRARARYLLDAVTRRKDARGPFRLLDIPCGPCSDILSIYDRLGEAAPAIDAVDLEPAALAHAAGVLGPRPGLRLLQSNAFDYRPDWDYDVIWCAGLADYLSDRALLLLLRRFRRWLAPGGTLIFGNFTPENLQRAPMDFCGWHLIHRSEANLTALARAVFPDLPVRVDREETGVNAFCVVGADLSAPRPSSAPARHPPPAAPQDARRARRR